MSPAKKEDRGGKGSSSMRAGLRPRRPRRAASAPSSAAPMTTAPAERGRQEFLALSYRHTLPAVEWVPLDVTPSPGPLRTIGAPTAREGHLSCVLDGRYLVVTGGYTADTSVYVKDLRADPPQPDFFVVQPSYVMGVPGEERDGRRRGARAAAGGRDNDDDGDDDPPHHMLHFAYGASLTPLGGRRAVQFGGFRAGGYSHECNQVAILTLDVAPRCVVAARGRNEGGSRDAPFSVSWQVVTTTTTAAPTTTATLSQQQQRRQPPPAGRDDPEAARFCEQYTKRAYHSATLVFDRYLLVLGGMRSAGSIWDPALLDTRTWTWTIPQGAAETARLPAHGPPPRHGHTALWDRRRSRMVVFGGGTGNDLLRSGADHADVWATSVPLESAEALAARVLGGDAEQQDQDGPLPWTRIADASAADGPLSPAEALCLGRCHVSHCVAPDTVLLAFGSGRPSTNGVLAFNLATHTFFRPRVGGPLPCPRFTATSVLWDSYLIVHGGYATQRSSELGDMHALDLAPALRRNFGPFRMPHRAGPGSAPVTDADAVAVRDRGLRQGMGELEALISLLHNRGGLDEEEFNRTLRNLFRAEIIREGRLRFMGGDDSDDDDDEEDHQNLDAEMEE